MFNITSLSYRSKYLLLYTFITSLFLQFAPPLEANNALSHAKKKRISELLNPNTKSRSWRAKDTKADDIKFQAAIQHSIFDAIRVSYSYDDSLRIFLGNQSITSVSYNNHLSLGVEYDINND